MEGQCINKNRFVNQSCNEREGCIQNCDECDYWLVHRVKTEKTENSENKPKQVPERAIHDLVNNRNK
jgi:hypothetical protein